MSQDDFGLGQAIAASGLLECHVFGSPGRCGAVMMVARQKRPRLVTAATLAPQNSMPPTAKA